MVRTIYVSRVGLEVEEFYFLPFYRTDKFWYMPQTYDTEELIFDNSVKRL
jgi:hypothetical protein